MEEELTEKKTTTGMMKRNLQLHQGHASLNMEWNILLIMWIRMIMYSAGNIVVGLAAAVKTRKTLEKKWHWLRLRVKDQKSTHYRTNAYYLQQERCVPLVMVTW